MGKRSQKEKSVVSWENRHNLTGQLSFYGRTEGGIVFRGVRRLVFRLKLAGVAFRRDSSWTSTALMQGGEHGQ